LGLQPPQRSRIAFARDLAQALAPQRRLHFGVQVSGRRFGLIGCVHSGSLIAQQPLTGGRTDRVRETRVGSNCRVGAFFTIHRSRRRLAARLDSGD
jgi:hypothetical protein